MENMKIQSAIWKSSFSGKSNASFHNPGPVTTLKNAKMLISHNQKKSNSVSIIKARKNLALFSPTQLLIQGQ